MDMNECTALSGATMNENESMSKTPIKDGLREVSTSTFARKTGYWAIKLGELVLHRVENALKPVELTSREYNVMTCISSGKGKSQQDLSRALGLYATGLVGLIDSLERRKLLSRERSTTDRRRYGLALTTQGRELLRRADTAIRQVERQMFCCVSPEEKTTLTGLMKRILSV
jgi:DNA-binding MarR family transcriptional regulator